MKDSLLNILKNVCKNHRSKQYFVASDGGEFYLPSQRSDCWCMLTQGVIGPDDKLVSADDCSEGRNCFSSQLAG